MPINYVVTRNGIMIIAVGNLRTGHMYGYGWIHEDFCRHYCHLRFVYRWVTHHKKSLISIGNMIS